MMIAVIGAGNMGGGLARLLAPKHEVAIGSRDKEKGRRGRRSSARSRAAATPTPRPRPMSSS